MFIPIDRFKPARLEKPRAGGFHLQYFLVSPDWHMFSASPDYSKSSNLLGKGKKEHGRLAGFLDFVRLCSRTLSRQALREVVGTQEPLGCEHVVHGGRNTEVRPGSGVGVRKERWCREQGVEKGTREET